MSRRSSPPQSEQPASSQPGGFNGIRDPNLAHSTDPPTRRIPTLPCPSLCFRRPLTASSPSPHTACSLGRALYAQGKVEEAADFLHDAYEAAEYAKTSLGASHPRVAYVESRLEDLPSRESLPPRSTSTSPSRSPALSPARSPGPSSPTPGLQQNSQSEALLAHAVRDEAEAVSLAEAAKAMEADAFRIAAAMRALEQPGAAGRADVDVSATNAQSGPTASFWAQARQRAQVVVGYVAGGVGVPPSARGHESVRSRSALAADGGDEGDIEAREGEEAEGEEEEEEEETAEQEDAATMIAAHQRGRVARRRAPGLVMKHPPKGDGKGTKRKKKKQKAGVRPGKKKAMKKGQKSGGESCIGATLMSSTPLEERLSDFAAATAIERVARGAVVRRKKKKQDQAATQIEAVARGRMVRAGKTTGAAGAYLGRILGQLTSSNDRAATGNEAVNGSLADGDDWSPTGGKEGRRPGSRPESRAGSPAAARLATASKSLLMGSDAGAGARKLLPDHQVLPLFRAGDFARPTSAAQLVEMGLIPGLLDAHTFSTIGGAGRCDTPSSQLSSLRTSTDTSLATRMARRRQERAEQRSSRSSASSAVASSRGAGTGSRPRGQRLGGGDLGLGGGLGAISEGTSRSSWSRSSSPERPRALEA